MYDKYEFMKVPVGGNRRYKILMDGNVVAGFDNAKQAKMFVAMQRAKTQGGGSVKAFAATRAWDVRDEYS